MKTFIKCELCDVKIPNGKKCVFAVYKKTIDGEDHYFCCEHHADEFERRHRKQE